jgi:hypothetical protein
MKARKPLEHRSFTGCWCRPRIDNFDGRALVVTHRNVTDSDVESYRIIYNDDGEFGWVSRGMDYIHVYPRPDDLYPYP